MFNVKRLAKYLATGVMPEMTALDESLAEHDKKYHPDGYKDGDSCNKRETMAGGDGVDKVEGKEGEARRAKGEQRTGSSSDRGNGVTAEEDAAYLDAVKRGDMETARRMVREAAEKRGYNDDSKYQGSLAFNGAAPCRNAYFDSKEERIEAWENGEFDDTQTLGDYYDGIEISSALSFDVFDPRGERLAESYKKESIRNLRDVINGKKKTIKMYRAVPSKVIEGKFRNGDWISPSRSYVEFHAGLNEWADQYRIIEETVSVEDIWWNGDDINEWGYDDGKEYVYKNTKNNRKIADVTYDDAGHPIPLSRRFDFSSDDIRY